MKRENNQKLNEAILWLLTIPTEELSDSMVLARQQMQKEGQNEIWLIDFFERKLSDEICDFINWNNNFLKADTVL